MENETHQMGRIGMTQTWFAAVRRSAWQTPVVLALTAAMLAGCRTAKLPSAKTVGPDPAPSVSEPKQSTPQEERTANACRELADAVHEYQAGFALAVDDAARLALAEALWQRIDAWSMQHPEAPPAERDAVCRILDELGRTRYRLRFRIARAEARQELSRAATSSEASQALGRELALVRDAYTSGVFSGTEREELTQDIATIQAAIARIEIDDLTEAAAESLRAPVTFQATRTACRKAIARLRQEAERPYWQAAERAWLTETAAAVTAAVEAAQAELDGCAAQIRAELRQAQKGMVNATAKKDYQTADGLYQAEKAKWFNWSILSRPRDSTSDLIRATGFCDRIVEEPRVDYPLRDAATGLRGTILDRFDGDETAQYKASLPLPAYTKLRQYPRRTEAEQQAEAECRWLLRRHAQPFGPAESEAPVAGTM